MGTVRSHKVFHPYTSETEIPIVCGVPEMCRIFQRSEPTIRGWCRDGKLPAFHIGDLWFANKSDLLSLVRLQK